MEEGLKVSTPIDPKSKYDLIVDNGKKLFRVQVKSLTFKRRDGFPLKLFTRTQRVSNNEIKQYSEDEVDMFVVYLRPLNMWYVIPRDVVKDKKNITIYPHSPHLYDVYEDAFYYFDSPA